MTREMRLAYAQLAYMRAALREIITADAALASPADEDALRHYARASESTRLVARALAALEGVK